MRKSIVIFIILFFSRVMVAQHDHHHKQDTIKKNNTHIQDTIKKNDPNEHAGHDHQDEMQPMNHAFSLNLPMTRNGSGTAWLPDSTPMYGYMIHGKKWMYMLHGNIFARYTRSDIFNVGSRGSEKFDAVNWIMGMGQRKVGSKGLFRFSVMMSLDNLFGGNGYPLLFQT